MFDLTALTLTELRSVARRLSIPHARTLRRGELLGQLSSRQSEAEAAWQIESPRTGRLVVHRAVSAMSASEGHAVHEGEPETLVSRGVEHLGTPASGAGRVADLALPKEPAPPSADLPWAYEDDRLVLLARDPRTLFTYWDFDRDTVRKAREAVPEGRPYLRLLSLGGSEPRVIREIEIDLASRSYYLYDLEPNRDYRVEILLRNPAGAEFLVGRPSNAVSLPPNRPSSWVEDRFASIPLDVRLPIASLFAAGRVSVDPERRLHVRSYELSGGEVAQEHTGDVASSSQGIAQGFGGRSWSGTLVKK